LSDTAINGTNRFVKWIFINPRNGAKRPSKAKHEERTHKAKHEERTQRNVELDEFYRKL